MKIISEKFFQRDFFFCAVLVFLTINCCTAQNLVQNPSFEQYTSCPLGNSGINLATPWDVPPGSITTPDYMNSCVTFGSGCNLVDVPDNFLGSAYAANGNAYVSIVAGPYDFCPDCREYIQSPLTSPLVAGTTYLVEMYVRPADWNKYLTNNMGIYLSSTQVSQPVNQAITTVTPQVESAAIISDTSQWTLVTGTYVATGGEQYITIGNFHDNANTLMDTVNFPGGSCILVTDGTMYMIDSVYVGVASLLSFSAADTTICQKFCLDFFDQSGNNPTAWLWQFPGGAPSSSTLQNPTQICYNTPGSYSVTLITTNANGNDTLTLVNYITVFPTPPFPTITQVGYTLTSSAAASYQWQFNSVDILGATNQSYIILQTGYYTVIVGDSNTCKNSATTYVLISGIKDVYSDANISIYPNPSSGSFMVEFSCAEASKNGWLNGLIAGEVSIDVVNTLGQIIFSSEEKVLSPNWKKQIDLNGVAQGVYFIEIKTQNEYVKKKIVVVR